MRFNPARPEAWMQFKRVETARLAVCEHESPETVREAPADSVSVLDPHQILDLSKGEEALVGVELVHRVSGSWRDQAGLAGSIRESGGEAISRAAGSGDAPRRASAGAAAA